MAGEDANGFSAQIIDLLRGFESLRRETDATSGAVKDVTGQTSAAERMAARLAARYGEAANNLERLVRVARSFRAPTYNPSPVSQYPGAPPGVSTQPGIKMATNHPQPGPVSPAPPGVKAGGTPPGGGAPSPPSPPGKPSSKPPGMRLGPHARLQRINEHIEWAKANGGDETVIKDLEFQKRVAEHRLHRINNPGISPGQRIGSAIAKTGFSFGKNGSGIASVASVGMEALGMGGPVGMTVMAAIALAQAFKAAIEGAAKLTVEFGHLSDVAGAKGDEAARLSSLGGSLGMSPGQMGSVSRSILDRAGSDPLAMGYAARFGAAVTPGPYGTQDSATVTLAVMRGLRELKGEERTRAARALGAEELLPATHMSDEQFGKMGRDAEVQAMVMTPEAMERAANFQAAQSRLSTSWSNFTTTFFGSSMESLTEMFNNMADTFDKWAEWRTGKAPEVPKPPAGVGVGAKNLPGTSSLDSTPPSMYGGTGGHGEQTYEGLQTALHQNRFAVEANTQAIGLLKGIVGGGERAQNAIPSALRGDNLIRAIELGSLPMGTI